MFRHLLARRITNPRDPTHVPKCQPHKLAHRVHHNWSPIFYPPEGRFELSFQSFDDCRVIARVGMMR